MTRRAPRVRTLVPMAVAALVVFLLFRPASAPQVPLPPVDTSFRWDAAELFVELEAAFVDAADATSPEAEARVTALLERGDALLADVAGAAAEPAPELAELSEVEFEMAVLGAAHPSLLSEVSDFVTRARVAVMRAAATWPPDRTTHASLYRVVFGGRIALEEALVQAGPDALPALRRIEEVPSETPSLVVEGVRIHSGDILLSRGGAPTSALIARGNDFPNTFSHAALAHVDPVSGQGMVIESLIEAGSVIHTAAEYLESQKHRILVLRLRPDHPALAGDPLLPHRAAEALLQRVREAPIPYDFAMAWEDPTEAFCSEIVFHAYREEGVDLWSLRGSMSADGLVRWLAQMGVREFTTLVPSDLEYDPAVRAVVEWRDAAAMMDYRLDNAIIDALLEDAGRGAELGFAWYALPLGRLLKAYSVGQSALGVSPTIPVGMSAATALRVRALVSEVHPPLKAELADRAAGFRASRGYEAPYWTLVDMAHRVLSERRAELAPALSQRASEDFR